MPSAAEILTPGELEQLLTVRAMLDGARRSAASPLPIDGITPVVLLDAVVERATHLAAVSLSLPVGSRDGTNELIPRITERLGDGWLPRALPDVRQLHRVRNSAQHEGVMFDPTRLPVWSNATDAYVRSLIGAQFGVDLDRIALTDAVRDAQLRQHLETAAANLACGEFDASIRSCWHAVNAALTRWRRLHSSRHQTALPINGLAGLPGHEDLRAEVDRLSELTDLAAFARDAADAVWFQALADVPNHLVDRDDAERALGFGTWWVLGFESASSTWVPDRQRRRNVASRLERDADESPARIESIQSVQHNRHSGKWDMVVRLADLPTEGVWRDWLASLASLTRDAAEISGGRWQIFDDGTAAIRGTDQVSVVDDLRVLHEALLRAEDVRRSAAGLAAATQAARTEEELRYRNTFAAAGPVPTWVREIGAVRPAWALDVMYTLITFDPSALDISLPQSGGNGLVQQSLGELPGVDEVHRLSKSTLEVRPLVDAGALATLLRGLDALVQVGLAGQDDAQRQLAAQAAQVREMAEDAVATLGSSTR